MSHQYFAKDGVFSVEPIGTIQGEEELGGVGIGGAGVGGGEQATVVEAQAGVELVGEDGAEDAPAAGAGAGGIAALDEEGLDDAVEEGAVVVALEAELGEVADRLGRLLGPKLDVQGAIAGVDHHLPPRRRLQIVHARHLGLSPPMESGR